MANDDKPTALPDLPAFLSGTEAPDTPEPATAGPPSLADQITDVLIAMRPAAGADAETIDQASRDQGAAIMHLLNEEGHYLPGCPPAAQILADAQQFAAKFMLAVLCVRLFRMLDTRIETPETKGMRRWLEDYVDGRNHGPLGKPMLWPSGLPGLAQQMRTWGYQPTPTKPAFVARKPAGTATIH